MDFSSTIEVFKQFPGLFIGISIFFGMLVGSFLNVVIYRLPVMMERAWLFSAREMIREYDSYQPCSANKPDQAVDLNTPSTNENDDQETQTEEPFNLLVPRSRCPKCNHLIQALENIPVLSYLWQLGRCKHCKTSISMRYPLIEAFTGLITGFLAWHFGPTLPFLAAVFFSWILISASMIDYDHQLLPDQMTLPLMWLGLILAINGTFIPLETAVIGAILGYMSLWSVFWLFKLLTGKDGMGFGDFKLLAALGAWCGWESLLSIIILSSFAGAAVGIGLIVLSGRDRSKPIPFGPYLAIAGWLYFMFGEYIDVRLWLFPQPYY